MPNDNVKDMVNSLSSGDNVKAQDAFKNALSDKIGQALDDKRQSVATDWLNSAPVSYTHLTLPTIMPV